MYALLHSSMEWVGAGIIVWLGIMVFLWRVGQKQYIHVFASACVWIFVYKIHGAISTASIMTATFAALLFDTFGLWILNFFKRSK